LKVSIITTAYNQANYIEKCIKSVICQTYNNWEQIIVDDGSTDETEEIVKPYLKDNRIKYIKKEHEGIMKLKNAYDIAIKLSNGELIAILEADDYWPENKLEIQVKEFDDPEVVLVWGRILEVDLDGNVLKETPDIKYTKFGQIEAKKELFFNNYIPAISVMIRKEKLIEAGGFKQEGFFCIDYPTWLSLIPYGKFKCMPQSAFGYWVKHGNNISTKYNESYQKFEISYKMFKKMPKKNRRELAPNDIWVWVKINKLCIKNKLYFFRLHRGWINK